MLVRLTRRLFLIAAALALAISLSPGGRAAGHREAPIAALDPKADITDVYAFVSDDDPPRVTLIVGVDAFLEPAGGPNWFPFDPQILYEIKVDADADAVEDVVFQFRFATEQRLPNLFQAYLGAGSGFSAPSNSPAPDLYGHHGEERRRHGADEPERRAAVRHSRQRRATDDGLHGPVQRRCGGDPEPAANGSPAPDRAKMRLSQPIHRSRSGQGIGSAARLAPQEGHTPRRLQEKPPCQRPHARWLATTSSTRPRQKP